MTTTNSISKAHDLGIECAEEAIEAGGSDPFDVEGRCLLPTEPMEGDWEHLWEQMGSGPFRDERRAFEEAYRERMSEEIKRIS